VERDPRLPLFAVVYSVLMVIGIGVTAYLIILAVKTWGIGFLVGWLCGYFVVHGYYRIRFGKWMEFGLPGEKPD